MPFDDGRQTCATSSVSQSMRLARLQVILEDLGNALNVSKFYVDFALPYELGEAGYPMRD